MQLRYLGSLDLGVPVLPKLLTLPDDLIWSDEHHWTSAVANTSYLLTGALLIESAVRQAGRPITLIGSADMGWVTREVVDQLYRYASVPNLPFSITFKDTHSYPVVFRHAEDAIEAEPVLGFNTWQASAFYRVTLRFMVV